MSNSYSTGSVPINVPNSRDQVLINIISEEIDKEISVHFKNLEENDKRLRKTLYSIDTLKLLCLSSRYDFDLSAFPVQKAIELRNQRFSGFSGKDLISEPATPHFTPKRPCCGCDLDSKYVSSPKKQKVEPQTETPPVICSAPPRETPKREPIPAKPVYDRVPCKFIVGSASRNINGKNELFVMLGKHADCTVKPQDVIEKVKFELELSNGTFCSPYEQYSPNNFRMTSTLQLIPGQIPPEPPKFCRITLTFKNSELNKTALCRVPLTIDYNSPLDLNLEGPKHLIETDLMLPNGEEKEVMRDVNRESLTVQGIYDFEEEIDRCPCEHYRNTVNLHPSVYRLHRMSHELASKLILVFPEARNRLDISFSVQYELLDYCNEKLAVHQPFFQRSDEDQQFSLASQAKTREIFLSWPPGRQSAVRFLISKIFHRALCYFYSVPVYENYMDNLTEKLNRVVLQRKILSIVEITRYLKRKF